MRTPPTTPPAIAPTGAECEDVEEAGPLNVALVMSGWSETFVNDLSRHGGMAEGQLGYRKWMDLL